MSTLSKSRILTFGHIRFLVRQSLLREGTKIANGAVQKWLHLTKIKVPAKLMPHFNQFLMSQGTK